MNSTAPPTAALDPVALVEGLNAESIAARLDELEREREALLVLLRAARRRGSKRERKEVANAAR